MEAMAEEVKNAAQQKEEVAAVAAEEVVVVADVPQAEKPAAAVVVVEKEPPPVPEMEEAVKPPPTEEFVESDEKIPQSDSFKEESTRVSDLPETEKKALEELKQLVQDALNHHQFTALPPPPPPPKEEEQAPVEVEEKSPEEEKKPETTLPEMKDECQPQETVSVVAETVVVAEAVEEKVDDDGAKTVEAIEETIVAVVAPPAEQPPPPPKEAEEAAAPPQDTKPEAANAAAPPPPPEEVFIWGIKLMEDERSDVILLKFLRARDFKVKEAFAMIKNTVQWRKEFGIDQLMDEELGNDLEKVVFMHGFDKERHPVCYNVYGGFQNKDLYQKTFSDEEKRQKFLRWRIQFLEKSIRKLDFTPGGISTIVQVNDLKNSPGPGKWELRQATKQALQLLQDNYPEFVAKQIFINVPWWYLAVNRMISPFLTQRTKSKFVFAGPSKSAETLFKYIAAEQVPVKYGGLSKEGEFGTADAVTEITVKPATKQTVEFPVNETCLLTWEVRVVGWEVSYGAEFVPSAEEGYTVIIQKARKMAGNEEPVVCNSFKIGEPGKVVITIDNPTSKKKKLLYRLKTKLSSD
ncbi:hypothetical protein AAG906_010583 [Vitis piasezkii]